MDDSSGLETPVGLSSNGDGSIASTNNKLKHDNKEDTKNRLIGAFVEREKANAECERRYKRREEKRAHREDLLAVWLRVQV